MYIDADRGHQDIPMIAIDHVRAVAEDIIFAQAFHDDVSYPAIFALAGAQTEETVQTQFKKVLDKHLEAQGKWYELIVAWADGAWSTHRHPVMINSLMRDAAKALGLEREWTTAPTTGVKQCPACFATIDDRSIICGSCKLIIDPERAKTLAFAK